MQFRLHQETRDRLRAEAKRRSVSVNYLIEEALEDRLQAWEKEKLGRK